MLGMDTCYSSNELPFNEEQNEPKLESVANTVAELWLFFYRYV